MRISGRITAWFPTKGFGYITARQGARVSRFFLHISRVISLDENLEEPGVGCYVSFEPTNNLKRHPKDIPSAIDADVAAPSSPQDPTELLLQVLSGKAGVR
jgi:hypothetical protein